MKTKLLFVLILFCFRLSAQDLHLAGLASNYSQTGRISKKWNYNIHLLSVYNASNLTIENKNFPSGHAHFIPHLLVNRKMTDKFTLGGGAAYGVHDIFGLKEREPRAMLQSGYQHKIKKLNINHRARLEFRFPKNIKTGISDEAVIGRYQIGVNLPLYNPKNQKKGFYGFVSNEMFLYLKGATNGPVSSKNGLLLSEDWANAGFGYNTGKNRIELGYGFQSLVRNKKQEMRYLNLLQINYHITLNWDDSQYWWYL